jgi:capsid assembly protease
MLRNLPHIFSRAFNVPLAITPARLDPLLAGLRAATLQRGSVSIEAIEPTPAPAPHLEIEWDRSAVRSGGYMISPKGVAWVPVRGVMVKREGEIDADSTEFESYARVDRKLRAALNDSRVRAVLLDLDSPGGEVGGLFDLAHDIRTAASMKPVWAIANDDAMSAGYALASAASRVWTTTTGGVGSVGVVATHTDQSGFDAAVGLVYTYIYAGEHKVEGNSHEPLNDSARAMIQTEVDRLYGMFVGMVAQHRGIEADAVRGTEAAVFYGQDAVTAKLADQVGTFAQAVTALGDQVSPTRSTSIMTEDISQGATVAAEPAAAITVDTAASVVNLDAVRSAMGDQKQRHTDIIELCKTANMMELVGEYIAKDMSVTAVRTDLQNRRAAADEARQIQTIDTTPKPAAAGGDEIHKVVAARFASQMGRA